MHVQPQWYFAEHQHEGVEIVGVLNGEVILGVDGECWHAAAGRIFVIPPMFPHSWSAEKEAELAVAHLVSVSRDLYDLLLPRNVPRILCLSSSQFAEYRSLFERVAAIGEHPAAQRNRLLRAYLEALLLILLEGDEQQDVRVAVMQEAMAYMRAHLHEPISIAQVARAFLMSEVTFRRHFRTTFGTSPKQYLLELRLTEAKQLLETSQLSVQEIARQMGFFDLAHFSATFKKRFGLSPSNWRAITH